MYNISIEYPIGENMLDLTEEKIYEVTRINVEIVGGEELDEFLVTVFGVDIVDPDLENEVEINLENEIRYATYNEILEYLGETEDLQEFEFLEVDISPAEDEVFSSDNKSNENNTQISPSPYVFKDQYTHENPVEGTAKMENLRIERNKKLKGGEAPMSCNIIVGIDKLLGSLENMNNINYVDKVLDRINYLNKEISTNGDKNGDLKLQIEELNKILKEFTSVESIVKQ